MKHEVDKFLALACKICRGSHHTLICMFENGERPIESQDKRRPDEEDPFDGPESAKGDQEYTYIYIPRNDESNGKDLMRGNIKGNSDLGAEDVLEAWEIEEATEAIEMIGYQDVLQIEKAEEAMEDVVLGNKSTTGQ